ncbi:MAG: hypothetical protein QXR45_14985 [Candidatus Bathyarchaeia archaeon]
MKAEVCQFCLRSGILCSKCRAKIESGEVTKLDLEIACLLVSIENECPYFKMYISMGRLRRIIF